MACNPTDADYLCYLEIWDDDATGGYANAELKFQRAQGAVTKECHLVWTGSVIEFWYFSGTGTPKRRLSIQSNQIVLEGELKISSRFGITSNGTLKFSSKDDTYEALELYTPGISPQSRIKILQPVGDETTLSWTNASKPPVFISGDQLHWNLLALKDFSTPQPKTKILFTVMEQGGKGNAAVYLRNTTGGKKWRLQAGASTASSFYIRLIDEVAPETYDCLVVSSDGDVVASGNICSINGLINTKVGARAPAGVFGVEGAFYVQDVALGYDYFWMKVGSSDWAYRTLG